MYSWLLVLVVLMVGGGNGGKRRRSSAKQLVEQPPEEEGSEYNPSDESGNESENDDEQASAQLETRSKRKEQGKGKEKAQEKGKEKGKGKMTTSATEEEERTYTRGKKRSVWIHEPSEALPPQEAPVPVDPKRVKIYSSKHCVGERYVGVDNLFRKVPGFQALFEAGNLSQICDFPDESGYGLELIREFYMRGGNLIETEGGPYQFTTAVRGVDMLITPETIGHVLEMPAFTGGVDYTNAGLDQVKDWRRVLNALCLPGAENNGSAIVSKDLRLEYRFLNFVVCYNIMPLANTKIIRWDRVLYMYLLGHPNLIQGKNLNINIPFLIWKRMARELKTANQKDRLPYPLLIMRILRFHHVNVTCTSYEHSLGPIGDTTIIKSRVQLHGLEPRAPEPPAPASPPPAQGSDTEASISSVYREQQRLSGELEHLASDQAQMVSTQVDLVSGEAKLVSDVARLNKKYSRISRFLRLLCSKIGCTSSEMPPPDSDSE